jgi:hypothetical protein
LTASTIPVRHKDRYHETLEQSSQGWHQGAHNPWPFINYFLWILKQAYAEFEQRVGDTTEPFGAKAELVRQAVYRQRGRFRISDIERACPGVGRDWIRDVLRQLKTAGEVRSSGRGTGARWERAGAGE